MKYEDDGERITEEISVTTGEEITEEICDEGRKFNLVLDIRSVNTDRDLRQEL